MKKMMMMAVVALTMAVNVNAQFAPGTWSISPKAGLGFANISNMEDLYLATEKVDNKMTYAASTGVEMEYQAAKMLGIAGGLSFTKQGTAWDDFKMDGVKMKDNRVDLTYIQVPIVANVYVAKGLALKAGVQFGFLIDSALRMTSEGDFSGRDATVDTSVDMNKDFKTFDLSIPVGLSYEFNNHIVLDARYHIGMTAVNKEKMANGKDAKNSLFLLSVGYKFGL